MLSYIVIEIMITEVMENMQGTCYHGYIWILVITVRRASSESTGLENL